MDLRTEEGHRSFIESGIWRDRCMRQLEMAVGRLAPLEDPASLGGRDYSPTTMKWTVRSRCRMPSKSAK